jgi:hypothetical protein
VQFYQGLQRYIPQAKGTNIWIRKNHPSKRLPAGIAEAEISRASTINKSLLIKLIRAFESEAL